MRQVLVTRYGGPEVLKIVDARDPQPAADEVRIAVRASGVNFADVMARVGLYPDAPRLPFVLGYEVAGLIDSVGDAALTSRLGQRVLALTKFGGYSSSVVVPARHALPIPRCLRDVDAAAIPVNYLTAFVALYKLANLADRETVLIPGAGGGVGIAATQLALLRNAVIIGVASRAKHEAILKFGVHHVIDPELQSVPAEVRRVTGGRGVDVVLDPVGGRHFRESYRLLAPLGRLVLLGASGVMGNGRNWMRAVLTLLQMPLFKPLQLINENRGVLGLNLGRLWTEEERITGMMSEILRYFEEGRLQAVIAKTFPLEDAAEGHRYLQARLNIGKVVLTAS